MSGFVVPMISEVLKVRWHFADEGFLDNPEREREREREINFNNWYEVGVNMLNTIVTTRHLHSSNQTFDKGVQSEYSKMFFQLI